MHIATVHGFFEVTDERRTTQEEQVKQTGLRWLPTTFPVADINHSLL